MRDLVEALCSDRCAGRAAGSPGGRLARGLVVDALRSAGLDPEEQAIPRLEGANVLAVIPGEISLDHALRPRPVRAGPAPVRVQRHA